MKFLIINNKNTESLDLLLKSLNKYVFGYFSISTFDATGKMQMGGKANVTSSTNLKSWIIDNLTGDPDDLYLIIDENKIVIDRIDIPPIVETMKNSEIFCFSLALGKNITFCSNMGCENILKPIEEKDGIIKWDWSVHYMDFGYPLNLDGTVFRGKELSKLIRNVTFSDTLELENGLQIFDEYPKNTMCAFSEGKMIEVVFENPNLRTTFDYKNLKKDRIKYQILENNENLDKVSDKVEA